MALDSVVRGVLSGTGADVAGTNQLKIIPETDAITNVDNIGCVKIFGENDGGSITAEVNVKSPEVDLDYRTRVAPDLLLDDEYINYTAQNTGKHNYANTTMTATWTAGQITTNGSSITTTTTGVQISTYAYFPTVGTTTLSCDVETAFSNQPVTNTFVEWGVGIPGGATAAPTDGVFFRLNSAGLQGICSHNGTETSTGVFPLSGGTGTWVYTNNKRYQFIVYQGLVEAQFWVNDGTGAVLLGKIPLPSAQGRMSMAQGAQFFYKHRIVGGAAGGVLQTYMGGYSIRVGGINFSNLPSTSGNRLWGSYQGLSGGTLGTLARYGTITSGNEANPAAAVPTTTTAALGTGLGGHFWETVTAAVNTDVILASYQVPAGTVNVQGRRLVVRGVGLASYVQTAFTGGGYVAQYFLAFGHTAVSLATAEAATTKAPRRVPLPITQIWPSAAAISTFPTQNTTFVDFGDAPIFVNPGEFIQLCTRHIGTAPSAGTAVHIVSLVYGWE